MIATQAIPNRGARLSEVPKQLLVLYYAAVNGFFDRMPVDRIAQYEIAITHRLSSEMVGLSFQSGLARWVHTRGQEEK